MWGVATGRVINFCHVVLLSVLVFCIKYVHSEGVNIRVATHLGDIDLIAFGPSTVGDKPHPVVMIPGMSATLKAEWVVVAEVLGQEGYSVAIVDLFGNPRTTPRGLNPVDFSQIVADSILKAHFKSDRAILMGKSWGAAKVAQLVSSQPELVSMVVLLAPPRGHREVTELLEATDVPVLVGWCADDPIAAGYRSEEWRALPRVQSNPARLVTSTPDSGGHVVSEEYVRPITTFLTAGQQ